MKTIATAETNTEVSYRPPREDMYRGATQTYQFLLGGNVRFEEGAQDNNIY